MINIGQMLNGKADYHYASRLLVVCEEKCVLKAKLNNFMWMSNQC